MGYSGGRSAVVLIVHETTTLSQTAAAQMTYVYVAEGAIEQAVQPQSVLTDQDAKVVKPVVDSVVSHSLFSWNRHLTLSDAFAAGLSLYNRIEPSDSLSMAVVRGKCT